MFIDVLAFLLAIMFVIVNGCTQVFYAKSLGYKLKPTGFAYFVGAIGNIITGNVVPISAQAETITVGGLIKNNRDRVTALFLAAIVGIVLGLTGAVTKIVDFSGEIVIYGMMAGVGMILSEVSLKMIKDDLRTGIISLISAVIMWVLTNDLVYTIAVSVLLSTLDFCLLRKKRVDIFEDENNEWRIWRKDYWKDFKLVKPHLSIYTILGALSIICLNIGSNISFGCISAGLASSQPNYDAITVINSLADIPSIMFGGMPLEVIISGTCSAPWPLIAGVVMMILSGILLMCGIMNRIGKYVPSQSIAGFLFIIGFAVTLVPNFVLVSSSDSCLEGIVAATVTMITKNAFLGILCGIIVKVTGGLLGIL